MVTRIRELLEARQLSPTQFADLIGVGRPVVSHILSERNKPSLEVVQRIVDAFPDISLSWLMKGTGSMLADIAPASAAAVPTSATPAPLIPPAPLEAASAVAPSPPILPAPGAPLFASQPQVFNPAAAGTPQPVGATAPAPRPLPPKFRPARAMASPLAATAPALGAAAAEPIAVAPGTPPALVAPAAPASPVQIVPADPVAAFATPPSPTSQPAPAAPVGFAPATLAPAHQQAAPAPIEAERPASQEAAPGYQPASFISQSMPAAASQGAPVAAASAADIPLATAPPQSVMEVPAAATNPAAALSFLGEPGKAIRRIVIFYRDGSFSDYVPEGY